MTTSSSSNWEDNIYQLCWNEICHGCIARDSPKWLCTVQWNTCTLNCYHVASCVGSYPIHYVYSVQITSLLALFLAQIKGSTKAIVTS